MLIPEPGSPSLADKGDANHAEAAVALPSILRNCRNLITSNFVIAESYILMLHGLGHTASLEFLERSSASPRTLIVYSTQEIEEEAKGILKKYADQNFSYTDAVSFAIMKRHKITKSFCFDKHFITAGFTRIP